MDIVHLAIQPGTNALSANVSCSGAQDFREQLHKQPLLGWSEKVRSQESAHGHWRIVEAPLLIQLDTAWIFIAIGHAQLTQHPAPGATIVESVSAKIEGVAFKFLSSCTPTQTTGLLKKCDVHSCTGQIGGHAQACKATANNSDISREMIDFHLLCSF